MWGRLAFPNNGSAALGREARLGRRATLLRVAEIPYNGALSHLLGLGSREVFMRGFVLLGALGLVFTSSGCSCSGTDPGELNPDAGMTIPDGGMQMTDAPGTDTGPTPIDGGPTDGGGMCADVDGDGVDTCAGDCDDANPLVYPGASEVCGDGVTNDCLSSDPPDTGCMGGIGTFVSEAGDDADPGTQTMPVRTIAQGMMNATTIGGGADVFVAEGVYGEDVTMVEGTSLLGGYDPTFATRDPSMYRSRINNTDDNGVFFNHGITRITELDGFTIRGRAGVANSNAITIAMDSAPTVSNNVVNGGNASNGSVGVYINPNNMATSASPLISNNTVNLGQAGSMWGTDRGSWGIRNRQTPAEIRDNTINLVDDSSVIARGIEIAQSAGVTVDGNTVRARGQVWGGNGIGWFSSSGTLNANDIDPGSCAQFCSGLAMGGDLTSPSVVTNNIIFGGSDATNGTSAVALDFEGPVASMMDVLFHSNFVHGGSSTARSAGFHFANFRPATSVVIGRLFNNIIYSGTGTDRYSILEQHPGSGGAGNIDPERVENNAFFVQMPSASGNAALYRDEGTTDLTTLAAVNGLSIAAGNIQDDCSVTRVAVGGDFHLGAGSMCIDQGSTTELPAMDFEGDARPAGLGPDIGPDEAG